MFLGYHTGIAAAAATQLFLGIAVMLLTEFGEPARLRRGIWTGTAALIFCANVILAAMYGSDGTYSRIGILTAALPYTIVTALCSRRRGLRIVFNVCTCMWLCCAAAANGVILRELFLESPWADIAGRAVSYAVFYVLILRFRPYYSRMIDILDRGWGALCLIPVTTFISTLYMINTMLPERPLTVSCIICGITAVCGCAYVLIYMFFSSVLNEYELKTGSALMETQRKALEREFEEKMLSEERMRIMRHDMRHRWTTAEALIEQGNREAAIEYIKGVKSAMESGVEG